MITITVGTNSWVTLDEANTYFDSRYASNDWHELRDRDKVAALITAFNQLKISGLFTFPTTTTSAMKQAQYEQAFFVVQNQRDMDARMALQAQGVVEAGVVKEKYSGKTGVIISPIAETYLDSLKISGSFAAIGGLEVDEDYDVED